MLLVSSDFARMHQKKDLHEVFIHYWSNNSVSHIFSVCLCVRYQMIYHLHSIEYWIHNTLDISTIYYTRVRALLCFRIMNKTKTMFLRLFLRLNLRLIRTLGVERSSEKICFVLISFCSNILAVKKLIQIKMKHCIIMWMWNVQGRNKSVSKYISEQLTKTFAVLLPSQAKVQSEQSQPFLSYLNMHNAYAHSTTLTNIS